MDEPAGSEIIPVEDWIMAATLGDAALVLEGLRRGIDVNARGVMAIKDTALTGAVREGRLDVIRILLEHGADMTLVDPYGFTPVTHAVIRSRPWGLLTPDHDPDSGPLDILVAAGAQYRLCEAVLLNDVDLARVRLDEGADPNANRWTYYGPLLMLAAVRGYLEVAALLLDRGADVDAQDDICQTSLMCAAGYGRTEMVRLLLDRGSDVDFAGWCGHSALANAAVAGHRDLVALLLSRGAKRGVVDAMAMNDIPLFQALLDEELEEMEHRDERWVAKVDSLCSGCVRLAMVAAERADASVVRILLDRGASHLQEDDDAHSLLAEAARHGRVDTARLLIERGADLHAVGRDGLSPLQWAIQEGQNEVAALLRRAGGRR